MGGSGKRGAGAAGGHRGGGDWGRPEAGGDAPRSAPCPRLLQSSRSFSRRSQDRLRQGPRAPVCLLLGPFLRAWAGVGVGFPTAAAQDRRPGSASPPRVTAGDRDREGLALLRAAPRCWVPSPRGPTRLAEAGLASLGLQVTLGAVYGTSSA